MDLLVGEFTGTIYLLEVRNFDFIILKKFKGKGLFALIVSLYAIGTTCLIMSSWWISQWTEYPPYPIPGKWGARDINFCKFKLLYQ